MILTADEVLHIQKVLAGDYVAIDQAFVWSDTPQGHRHWQAIYSGTSSLTEEDIAFLEKLVEDSGLKDMHNRKFEYRAFSLNEEGELQSEVFKDYEVTEYRGRSLVEGRNTPYHYFLVTGGWRDTLNFYGVLTNFTTSSRVLSVVEKLEDGGFKVFGEVDPTLVAFGIKTPEDLLKYLLKRKQEVGNWITYDWEASGYVEDFAFTVSGLDAGAATEAAHFYRPKFIGDNVEVYMNVRDLERDRRTKIRLGRFLRLIFPKAVDSQLETIQNKYRERFVKREFTVNRGSERKDFRLAYTGETVRSLNPRTNSSRKSIHNSCMQDEEVQGLSPAETYASGDFEILYLTDDKGHIAGRVVVYVNHNDMPQAGPVYGACEHSIDMLEEELDKMGAVRYEDASWKGANLLKIEVYGSDYLVCYNDVESEAYDDGDYFVIGRGDVELHTTQGYTAINRQYCCSCDETVHEEDVYSNSWGETFCRFCYEDRYVQCEVTHTEISIDDAVEVLTSDSRIRYGASVQNPRWIMICGESVAYDNCEYEDNYWLTDDMVQDVDENYVSPRYAANNMLLIDGVYYTEEQLKEHGFTPEGVKIENDAEEEEKEEAA